VVPSKRSRGNADVLQAHSGFLSVDGATVGVSAPTAAPPWLGDAGRAELTRLDVDFLAFGLSVLTPQLVRIDRVIHHEGEVNDAPATMHSHCASLLAVWGTARAPTVVDLGECLCIGKRLLPLPSRYGRRFAVHAIALHDQVAAFGVISSSRLWPDTAQARLRVLDFTEGFHRFMRSTPTPGSPAEQVAQDSLDWFSFSAREVQILRLLARGLSNKLIARVLGSSPNTIRNQIHAVFRKAAVSNRTELAVRAARSTQAPAE
jgi:DNA-binding CsgD family transcriptional regulator